MEKNISLLGSTGSIGTQTLEVARKHKFIKISALAAMRNVKLMEEQAREFHPALVCMADEKAAADLKVRLADTDIKVGGGEESIAEAAVFAEADTVITAVVGISGLKPTIEAIKSGKNIALANKETLVTGGHIVMPLAKKHNSAIIPVDSEHSAIFQSLMGNEHKSIKKIILTASGGPFLGKKAHELTDVSPEQALAHPNWKMGAKVTIDSSTLVNKGLEVIEAKWLFGVDADKIEALIHRQSIIHSMVQYNDNAVIAQLGMPDMKLPIQFALTYPKRADMSGNELDFTKCGELTFEKPDTDTFKALDLAYRAIREGGIMPCVFNSSDEAAVELFLQGKIKFLEIAEKIENAMDIIKNIKDPKLSDILNADAEARRITAE